jgi:pyruvate/2-oxoacid:ferredoxin oxidoreductase alpha subunit
MNSAVEYYRIIDADYVLVGLNFSIAAVAKNAVAALRCNGLRVGAMVLAEPSPLSTEIAELLAQARAIGVVESRRQKEWIGPALMTLLLKASARPEWYAPGRIPRVYSAVLDVGTASPREEHLISLAKAMHRYEPQQILLTADGLARPVSRISDHTSIATGARPV